ncbi:hypothetical protein ACA910_002155 [Epithemia clementina (nom. ined.)]
MEDEDESKLPGRSSTTTTPGTTMTGGAALPAQYYQDAWMARPSPLASDSSLAAAATAAALPSAAAGGSYNRIMADLSQLPELRTRIRRHVHDLITQCLPSSQTQAYLQATHTCPELIRNETDPLQFVRCCHYDILAGAQRLCLYWTQRWALFGPTRACLPLVLMGGTAGGALCDKDLLTIRAAVPALLPDTTSGQKCILLDPRRRISSSLCSSPSSSSLDHILRACFYIFRVMAEDDSTQIEGAHCLFVVSTPRSQTVDWEFLHRISYLMTRVFPVRIKVMHLIGIPQQKRPLAVGQVMTTALGLLRQQYFVEDWMEVQVHVETKPKQILQELSSSSQGGGVLTPRGIPLSLGGEWKLEDFSLWCQERMMWERSKHMNRWAAAMEASLLVSTDAEDEAAKERRGPAQAPPQNDHSKPLLSWASPRSSSSSTSPSPATMAAALAMGAVAGAPGVHVAQSTECAGALARRIVFHHAVLVLALPPPAAVGNASIMDAVAAPTRPPPKATAGGDTAANTRTLRTTTTTAAAGPDPRTMAALEEEEEERESEEERIMAKRRIANLISSRRKRERQRERVRLLQEESCHLAHENQRLQTEQTRLLALWNQAKQRQQPQQHQTAVATGNVATTTLTQQLVATAAAPSSSFLEHSTTGVTADGLANNRSAITTRQHRSNSNRHSPGDEEDADMAS